MSPHSEPKGLSELMHARLEGERAGADPGLFQRGGCKSEGSRQMSQGQRNGGGGEVEGEGNVLICRFSSF